MPRDWNWGIVIKGKPLSDPLVQQTAQAGQLRRPDLEFVAVAKMVDPERTELPTAQGIVTALPNVSATATRGGASRISRPSPDQLLHHDVSDEELASLGEMKRDHLWDFMWIMLGIAVGAAPSAVDHIYRHFWIGVAEHLSLKGLVEILITVTGAAIFLVLYFVVYTSKKSCPDMVVAIRERTKHRAS